MYYLNICYVKCSFLFTFSANPLHCYVPRQLLANEFICDFEYVLFRVCILVLISDKSAWLNYRVLLRALW